jgi:hypothetical protein
LRATPHAEVELEARSANGEMKLEVSNSAVKDARRDGRIRRGLAMAGYFLESRVEDQWA